MRIVITIGECVPYQIFQNSCDELKMVPPPPDSCKYHFLAAKGMILYFLLSNLNIPYILMSSHLKQCLYFLFPEIILLRNQPESTTTPPDMPDTGEFRPFYVSGRFKTI